MSEWVFGAVSVLLGILGAVLAANAVDDGMSVFGIGLVAFAVLFGIWLIKDHFDMAERARAQAERS